MGCVGGGALHGHNGASVGDFDGDFDRVGAVDGKDHFAFMLAVIHVLLIVVEQESRLVLGHGGSEFLEGRIALSLLLDLDIGGLHRSDEVADLFALETGEGSLELLARSDARHLNNNYYNQTSP